MTIEEMISVLTGCTLAAVPLSEETLFAVCKALRAAQQMRTLLERNEANLFTLLGSVVDAREAWDAATRGGE